MNTNYADTEKIVTVTGTVTESTYNYAYNYTYMPPLAMVDVVPVPEAFSARPAWIFEVARSALKLLINAVMIGIHKDSGFGQYVQSLLAALHSIAGQLKVDAEADLLKAFEQELEKVGVPTTEPELKAFLEGVAENFAKTIGVETLGDILKIILNMGTVSGPANSIEDYNQLFQFIPLPAVSQNFTDDSEFAAMRVAGANPLMIERLKAADARLPITEKQYQSVMGEQDSLGAALADGRLYLADYSVFDGAVDGSYPASAKFNYAPLALFAIPPGGSSLVPVAIQCAPQPGADNPIFLPPDGDNWLIAKTIVQIADANFHEAVSHLGRTHLFVGPFVIATHRILPTFHPLFLLLTPHFLGTLAINDAAQSNLIASGGAVDQLLSSTIDQSRTLAVKGAQSYLLNINTSTLPQTLAQRGVDDPNFLPDYPYRDDALLLWNAINQWVSQYINHYYASDAAVQNDAELENWVTELVAHDGGRLNNIGEANKISTSAQLIELVTQICFTASAQHAAVNYPQGTLMSYAPAMPLAGYTPAPATQEGSDVGGFFKLLPPLDIAELQMEVLYLLGSVYFTKLGDYGDNYFAHDPVIQGFMKQFQQNLVDIEAEINLRNQTRTPYEFLLPSKIPQSINI
jgi:arachidonate 15-lipoxygenase